MLRFRITTILFLVTLVAIGLAWWTDHKNLRNQLDYHDSEALLDALDWAVELKFNQKSPSYYFDRETADFEEHLSMKNPVGDMVQSKGWSKEPLRKPSQETTDAALTFLHSGNLDTKLIALKLLALYSESFIVEQKYAYQKLEPEHEYFCANVTPELYPYLTHRDNEIRGHAALAIGFTCRERDSIDKLTYAFKNETDTSAKRYIAWALARQF